MSEDTADLIKKLKEATRETHEALKEARTERRKLESLKSEIRELIIQATTKAIEVKIEEGSKLVFDYQRALEAEVKNRFDEIVNGPLQDLEKLLRNLHKVHSTVPMSAMAALPDNPLFPKSV